MWRLILSNIRYHRRASFAVAMAVAAAAAVMSGALVIGDSVRASLRRLTLERLGDVDEVLVVDRFFRSELANELQHEKSFEKYFRAALPAILLEGSVSRPADATADGRSPSQSLASGVSIIGCDERFWKLGSGGPSRQPNAESVVLNSPLADELGVQVGQEIVLRIGTSPMVPADSFLGKKEDTTLARRLRVAAIIPARGLGRFALRPSQRRPLCLFASTKMLQEMLDVPGRVNAILVAGKDADRGSNEEASRALQAALRPTLSDYGINVEHVQVGAENSPAADYVNVTSERMMLPGEAARAVLEEFGEHGAQPVMTYLANVIAAGDKQIPYSIVAGVDSTAELGPLLDDGGRPLVLDDEEIVLNRWAADDLGVVPGDKVSLRFYEPESTHGTLKEEPPVEFTLRTVVPLESAAGTPTVAADPQLTPEMAGVTDQESINDWDLPFTLVEKIRPRDEDYWDRYRTTPKAFVSLATARRLWSSRFGSTSVVRIPVADGLTVEAVEAGLKLDPEELGFVFLPVKRLGLQAAAGTTSFSELFIAFSSFIIAAAVMLVALLFRLAVAQRASEIGILSAVGLPRWQLFAVLMGEGLLIALAGTVVGVAGGVGYAALMLAGLRTWWLAAIVTPFLTLDVRWTTLLIGGLIAVFVSLLAIGWSLRAMRRMATVSLLAGDAELPVHVRRRRSGGAVVVWSLLVVAVLSALSGMWLSGEAQIGTFFFSGMLVLVALLLVVRRRLIGGGSDLSSIGSFGLWRLAARNAARHATRSTLTMGLVAAVAFLIVAVSAFRLSPTPAGTGQFELVAESAVPIYQNLNTADGRLELGFSEEQNAALAECTTYAVRVQAGGDASCLNLYRSTQPRILGVPRSFLERGEFAWAASAARTEAERNNPLLLVEQPMAGGQVPVVLDATTAVYSLHLSGKPGETITVRDERGEPLQLVVVGLLQNSMLQGNLVISEEQLTHHFPGTSGYRMFFCDVDKPTPANVGNVQRVLETALSDYGLDATAADERLAGYLEVQNTYLATFQSLGALGLLLGTFGLAAVELRNVLERRGELALMRATGFARGRLAALVMIENGLLLLGGLAVGVLAALVAVLPHLLQGGAGVPWRSLAVLLGIVLITGSVAAAVAARRVVRMPLLPALRAE